MSILVEKTIENLSYFLEYYMLLTSVNIRSLSFSICSSENISLRLFSYFDLLIQELYKIDRFMLGFMFPKDFLHFLYSRSANDQILGKSLEKACISM